MNWTVEQQKVIDSKNKNILVSAAAGSGKTAVLVERIVKMISEDKNIDIDKLLIVTFTNAAAAEMKERIEKIIENYLSKEPENQHLQKQMSLIHNAQITTIHSFCLSVIRNNFHVINIDPAFRLVEEAELTLLKSDVVKEVLEQYYKKGEEDFLEFIESYSLGKSDKNIEEIILEFHNFSKSYPWPYEWLEGIKKTFNIHTQDHMERSNWMKYLLNYIKTITNELYDKINIAINICNDVNGPYMYLDAVEDDEETINKLLKANSYAEYSGILENIEFKRLSVKKDKDVWEEKKEQVKRIRNEVKDELKDIKAKYFFQSKEEMINDIKSMKSIMEVLIKLVTDFDNLYKEYKRDKNLVDFNDLEHMALEILIKKENNKIIPTDAANELSNYYDEIIIDEYQDSNYIQEIILNSVSKEKYNKPNVFMVGDVKQSIYKFRLARPELFMEKFHQYYVGNKDEDERCIRIDLHKNFRSRREVLCGINFIFNQIMSTKIGNIEYNNEAALYEGVTFEETNTNTGDDIEVIIVDSDSELLKEYRENKRKNNNTNEDEDIEYTIKELEAKAIAIRIKELIHDEEGLYVWNKVEYKRAEFKDIVILTRAMSGWADVFVNVLTEEGIPAHAESSAGYFSTIEIRTILNLLKIIDNPLQDIPLAAVMKSPIVKVTAQELALIKALHNKKQSLNNKKQPTNLYSLIKLYILEGENDKLKSKLEDFMTVLNKYREWIVYIPIHEFLIKMLDDTGYRNYVSAMPSGVKRKANIDMLIQKAIQFEKTSYSGLFNFIRYIEKLEKYNVDFGEAVTAGEKDNIVRIMSIHKSKGLEFPIVFVAGMGKGFNNMDITKKIVIDSDLGPGPEYIDYKLRLKAPTLIKRAIQKKIQLENLGEELRVLYVAMTRAKEKLIMIGGVDGLDKKIEKWGSIRGFKEEKLPFQVLTSSKNYFDLVMSALGRHEAFAELTQSMDTKIKLEYSKESKFNIKIVKITELIYTKLKEQISKELSKEELLTWDNSIIYDEKYREIYNKRLNFKYKYHHDIKLKAKVTVTELKKLTEISWEDYEDENIFEDISEEAVPIIPQFMNAEKEITKAFRGTVYHKLLEIIDLQKTEDKEYLISELNTIKINNILTEEEKAVIDLEQISKFYRSNIALRMRKAHTKGKLHREKQFIISMKANETELNSESDEAVLIQGTIDVFFEEDGEYVIVDYKTDMVKNAKELTRRYKTQLEYYQKALEQIYGKKVKEKIIYSFTMGEELIV